MFPDTSYGHMHVNSQGTLRIQGVQREDAGFLVCSALSVAGSTSVRAFLQVSLHKQTADLGINFFVFQVTSVADLPPPIIQIGPANQTLPLHSMVTLHCKASSPEGEQPKIRWLKDGTVISAEHPPERYSISQTGTLDIDGNTLYFKIYCKFIVYRFFQQICVLKIQGCTPVQQLRKVVKVHGQRHSASWKVHPYRSTAVQIPPPSPRPLVPPKYSTPPNRASTSPGTPMKMQAALLVTQWNTGVRIYKRDGSLPHTGCPTPIWLCAN